MKKILFYDMDNTIAEMSKALEDISSARLTHYYTGSVYSQEEKKQRLHSNGFFQNLSLIANARETLQRLVKEGHIVRMLSQPMVNGHCIDEKNYWLDKYFPFIPRHHRFYTFDKYLLANTGRILVDDNIEHLEKWEKMGGVAICFRRGYNKSWKGLAIRSHRHIFRLLEKLEGV